MNKRNFLVCMLCFVMLFQAVAVSGVYAEESVDAELARNVQMLHSLGIFDEEYSEISLGQKVTRVDFAMKVARIFGNSASQNAIEPASVYSDTEGLGAEAVQAVNMLTGLGLISGSGNGMFNPDGIITYEQAIKIFVCALGYDEFAKQNGGYPYGYISEGARIGLTEDINIASSEQLSWEAMINLISNALFIDIMQTESYGVSPTYKVVKDENLITNVMNITIYEDVRISANSVTAVEGNDYTNPGYVKIDGKLYFDPSLTASECIGREVDVYCKNINGKDTVLYAELITENVLTVKLEDVVSADGYTVIWYDDKSGKDKKIKIADDAYAIVNGELCLYKPEYIDTSLCGYVTFEASDDSNSYSTVIISAYSDMVVREVDYASNAVYDAVNPVNALYLDKYISEDRCLVIKNGNVTDINGVSVDSILSVYRTPSDDYITIRVCSSKITGVVNEVGDDEIIIDDEAYSFASYLKSELSSSIGKKVTLFVNPDKVIIMKDDSSDEYSYGYLTGVSNGNGGIDTKASVKVLSQDNKWLELDLPEKIILNGKRTTADMAEVVKSAFVKNNEVDCQLIQYKLNTEGVVTAINTADYNDGNILNFKSEKDFYCSVPKTETTIRYKGSKKTFSGKVTMNDDTKIFVVDPSNAKSDRAYAVVKSTYFTNDSYYTIAAYNMDEGGVAGAVVCYKSLLGAEPEYSSATIMIDTVTDTLDADGEPVQKVKGLVNGAYAEYITNGDTRLEYDGKALKRGDVARITFDIDSKICGMTVDVKADRFVPSNNAYQTPWNSQYWAMTGAVYSRKDTYALVSNSNPEDLGDIFEVPDPDSLYAITLSGTIMIYDSSLDIIYAGTVNDIMSYDAAGSDATRFYARFNYESCINMFIFK